MKFVVIAGVSCTAITSAFSLRLSVHCSPMQNASTYFHIVHAVHMLIVDAILPPFDRLLFGAQSIGAGKLSAVFWCEVFRPTNHISCTVHRPSSKGTKLLLQVIKAIINQLDWCCFSFLSCSQLAVGHVSHIDTVFTSP